MPVRDTKWSSQELIREAQVAAAIQAEKEPKAELAYAQKTGVASRAMDTAKGVAKGAANGVANGARNAAKGVANGAKGAAKGVAKGAMGAVDATKGAVSKTYSSAVRGVDKLRKRLW